MAKVKVVNNVLDSNLNGVNFNNTASQTIFSFGRFVVTSNFEGRIPIDYTGTLSSFVRPVTLETLGLSQTQSEILLRTTTNAVLNLDKSDLNTFVRYGSAYEFLRVTIENIILSYPASLFMNSQTNVGGNITFSGFSYNSLANTSVFKIPTGYTSNIFGLVLNAGNTSTPDGNELRNLNLSYDKYIVWSQLNPTGNSYSVIGFTGYSSGSKYITLKVQGNPFPMLFTGDTSGQSGSLDFHLKPNNVVFEEFRTQLSDYEKYILSKRVETSGFEFMMKDPTLLDDGSVNYVDTTLLWYTSDGYNVDISGAKYRNFLEVILRIGSKYDAIKTDLIARFLTPTSIKTYDLTEEGKMTKLLRLYGREFDELRQFIDSLVNINRITYNKINNAPDQLIKNLAKTFGWDYFSLVNENEFVETILTIDDTERDLYDDLLPAEIDIELWRRILNNTNYYWKSKGTREAIKSMFLLIGIPEPFINITEYVYTVDGKINPNSVTLTEADFPSNSLPYNTDGYPIAPLETNEFYFQISGDTDSGQAYMDVFRMAGFNLIQTVDNKKSWVEEGAITRIDDTTPQYYQQDSKLVLNTKEVDVALDTARGIEYDVYDYIKNTDFPANSSGYTLPYTFVNISLGFTGTQNSFTLPYNLDEIQGDFEVRYNGILLKAPKTGSTGGTIYTETEADYSVSGNVFTILNGNYAINSGYRRDVIQATLITSGGTSPVSGITVEYVVTRVKAKPDGTAIPLPSMPRGDVQVTIDGIALTKGTSSFSADYIVDPNNTTGYSQIIIQNPTLISYLMVNPDIQVTYVEVIGSDDIAARSEVLRVDSFSSSKLYYNISASKYVYKLNYKANSAEEIKVLIDGIAIEPNTDYSVNSMNPYEIFLPSGIKYGMVISVYYLVGGNSVFNPVVNDSFGVGDISQLSFLEFLELIQRRMINVRTRKTVTDFKGGWYPTLLNVYLEYLKRAELDPENPLLSNGYTFSNLYTFLSKYNAFFQRFIDQLLSATIILKKGGLLVRNTVFTKQKFTYKRGVNLYAEGSTAYDMRGFPMVQYLGDAGSVFMLGQEPEPPPIVLSLQTKAGIGNYYELPSTLGDICSTGGINISGFEIVDCYGMKYRINETGCAWQQNFTCGTLSTNSFNATINNVCQGKTYQYMAVVKAGSLTASGNTLSISIPTAPEIVPSAITCNATMGITSITNTGGIILPSECGAGVDYYGMQYRAIGTVGEISCLDISPTALTYTSAGGVQYINICSDPSNVFTIINPISGWTMTEAPEPPAPLGILHGITVAANSGGARSGVITYSASSNSVDVCVSQAAFSPTSNPVYLDSITATTSFQCSNIVPTDIMVAGQCYALYINWRLCKPVTTYPAATNVCLCCNGVGFGYGCSCSLLTTSYDVSGVWGPIIVDSNDTLVLRNASLVKPNIGSGCGYSCSTISISCISGKGNFVTGSPAAQVARTYNGPAGGLLPV